MPDPTISAGRKVLAFLWLLFFFLPMIPICWVIGTVLRQFDKLRGVHNA
jgi:hypothetical protein